MWVVDTCVVIDLAEDDPEFGKASAKCLDSHLSQGLCISPVTYVELAPVFMGLTAELDKFMAVAGLSVADFTPEDRKASFAAWHGHVSKRREGNTPRRPIADIFIGALARRFQGLITRNAREFQALFPEIAIVNPSSSRKSR